MSQQEFSLAFKKALMVQNDLEFLDAVVEVGPPSRLVTADEFRSLPALKRNLILTRALWLKFHVGDVRDFLEESVCGDYVRELKLFLQSIGARHASELLESVESVFPAGVVPAIEEERRSLLAEIDRTEPALLDDFTKAYMQKGEDIISIVRAYLVVNVHHRWRGLIWLYDDY